MKVNLLNGRTETVSDRSTPAFKPQLSSDNNWLVYGSKHANKTGLRLHNLKTGDERWLIRDIGFNALESWASRDLLPGFAFTPTNDSLVIAYDGKIRRINLSDGQVTNIPFRANVQMEIESRVTTTATIDQGAVTARLAKGAVVSPDGTQYAFSAFGRLYRMAIADQTPHKLNSQADFGEFHPAWSPNGTWLAYVSWSASEGGAIWKVPADGSGPAVKLSVDDAYYRNPVWSPDGKTILAVRAPKIVRLENNRRPMAKAEQIVRLASNGGKHLSIAPAGGAVRVHFTEDAQRFHAYSPRLGLSSWKLDGSDQKTVLRVMGLASATGNPAIASDILLSPNGQHALATVANQLYLINLSALPAEQPTINVYAPGDAYTKITTLGADHFSWSDSNMLAWSAGHALYLRSIDTDTVQEVEALVQQPRHSPKDAVALRGARIITMDGDKVIRNGDILIDGNRIQAVGTRGTIKIPKTAKIINVRGKTIMPGIVDIHAHWSPKRSVLDLEDHDAYANLAYGVTAIRDPQSMTDDIFIYSDAVDTGEMVSPRIFSTGRGVFFFNNFQSYEQVYGVLERYKKKYRTHLIKSYLPGSRQVRQWVIRACRELGLIVTAEGGSDSKANITFALDGFSGTEHAVPIVPLHKDIVQLFALSGISYTPTLLVSFGGPFAVEHFINNQIGLKDKKLHRFMPASLIKQRIAKSSWVEPKYHIYSQVAKGAKEILDAGGNIGLGGHGEMQGLQVHWEMWALAAGGMDNLDVLRVATLESAKAIGLDTEIGSIEVGKLADLVVMDSNPLDDIAHTNSISRVMVNGTLYNANTLAQQWPQRKDLPTAWWQIKELTSYD
jgi:WD40 repeat protein